MNAMFIYYPSCGGEFSYDASNYVIHPDRRDAMWFCDGYGGGVVGVYSVAGSNYQIWSVGEMKVIVTYTTPEGVEIVEKWRTAYDIEHSSLFNIVEGAELSDTFLARLGNGEIEGATLEWDNNPWFEAYALDDEGNPDLDSGEDHLGHDIEEVLIALDWISR